MGLHYIAIAIHHKIEIVKGIKIGIEIKKRDFMPLVGYFVRLCSDGIAPP